MVAAARWLFDATSIAWRPPPLKSLTYAVVPAALNCTSPGSEPTEISTPGVVDGRSSRVTRLESCCVTYTTPERDTAMPNGRPPIVPERPPSTPWGCVRLPGRGIVLLPQPTADTATSTAQDAFRI